MNDGDGIASRLGHENMRWTLPENDKRHATTLLALLPSRPERLRSGFVSGPQLANLDLAHPGLAKPNPNEDSVLSDLLRVRN